MEETYGNASLHTVRLSELERNESSGRQQQLLSICMTDGFFWLDVGENSQLARAMTDLLSFAERLFNIPEEEKRKFPFETTGRGACSG
jgi:isopenicillin N synthase-like dioxygenase